MRMPCDEAVVRSGGGEGVARAGCERWILAATILASSMAFIDGTVVNVALPALLQNFHTTVAGAQWVVESYGIFLSALILVGGALGDALGRRRVFLVGTVIFAIASVGCGMATSLAQLVMARSVQGIGAAMLVPGSLSIISASFREDTRGQAIGTWSGFTAITTGVGPVLGGWLIQHASWRWAFFVNVPLAAAVIVISLWRVPESRSNSVRSIDVPGAIAATFGLAGITVGLIEAAELGGRHPLVIVSLVLGIFLLACFLLVEKKSGSPMVPLELFQSRSFSAANLLTLFLYAGLSAFFFLFPMDLIQVHRYTPTAAGAAASPMIVLMFLLSHWSGSLVARIGPRVPLVAGPLFAAAGFALIALLSKEGHYWTNVFPGLLVLGFGMSVTVAPLTTVVMGSVSEDRTGAASGINNAIARVAGVLAIAVLGILMVQAFSQRLSRELVVLNLPVDAKRQIDANRSRLAALEPPQQLDASTRDRVGIYVRAAFQHGFQISILWCAGLAAASAGVAAIMIPAKPPTPS